MEKRDKKIPYEVVIQERKRVDLYGNIVYYIHWFDERCPNGVAEDLMYNEENEYN